MKLKKGAMYHVCIGKSHNFGTYLGTLGDNAIFNSSSFASDCNYLNGEVPHSELHGRVLTEIPGGAMMTEFEVFEFLQKVLPV